MAPSEHPKDKKPALPEIPSPGLEAGEILTAEFAYIAQSAFQANEDRARTTSYYLVSVGTFIAAILGTQFFSMKDAAISLAFAALFFFLAALALLTILQLVRLRKAWWEAALAMGQIKEYYIRRAGDPHLAEAFRWRKETLPAISKRPSISFYLTLEVALIGGASAGVGSYLGMLGFGWYSWPLAALAGVLYFVFELVSYQRMLKAN